MNYVAIVNTINRPQHLLERCLNALLLQRISPIKVILIDQNEKQHESRNELLIIPSLQDAKLIINLSQLPEIPLRFLKALNGFSFVMMMDMPVRIIQKF